MSKRERLIYIGVILALVLGYGALKLHWIPGGAS